MSMERRELSDAIELCSVRVGNAADALRLIISALEDQYDKNVMIQNALDIVYFTLDSQASQLSDLACKI